MSNNIYIKDRIKRFKVEIKKQSKFKLIVTYKSYFVLNYLIWALIIGSIFIKALFCSNYLLIIKPCLNTHYLFYLIYQS